jgi:hypothetical protein
MTPPTFYLETSVWGSLAPRQPRDRKQVVQRLLQLLDGLRGIGLISRAVSVEIEAAPPDYTRPMLKRMKRDESGCSANH